MAAQAPNVYLFWPNIIGYARVVLAFAAFYFVEDPWRCVPLYMLSAFLDVLDGYAARAFNQSSRFGAVLDMVTDRCGTTCLMMNLAQLYPAYTLAFQLLLSLDFSSHYIHMYSSLLTGASSHKTIDQKHNWFLRAYYSSRMVLFSFCAGNELFFIMLYLRYFTVGAVIAPLGVGLVTLLALLSAPIMITKQVLNVIQFMNAANVLVKRDQDDFAKAK